MKYTTLIQIEKDNQYLMLYRNKKKQDVNQGKWIGVGGKLEAGESPDACAIREAYEETGLKLNGLNLKGIIDFRSEEYEDEMIYLYTCDDFSGTIREDCEEGMLRWIPFSDLMDLNLWEGDRIFLKDLLDGKSGISLTLSYKGDTLSDEVKCCTLCPRECGAVRTAGKKGICHCNNDVIVSRVGLHMWEEPCISGDRGSGTVFFGGCSLGCIYCQNHAISGGTLGKIMTERELVNSFFELKEMGAHNINLVTSGHFPIQTANAVRWAKAEGLEIPIVYNTSSYEKVSTLKIFHGLVDIYLADYKYADSKLAEKYSSAPDYPEIAMAAIEEMLKQVGEPEFDENGMMVKGVIIRHLLIPGNLAGSKKCIRRIYETFGDRVYISIMSQFTPGRESEYPELNRKVTSREYDSLVNYACQLGVSLAFIQEGDVAKESFIPDFS